ncbi:M28 family peptidase [Chloroflexia bacterium SDU3-3]|nr:M28 family peptidase [Chloroflexia bacterium SDU3-3]
MPSAAQFSGERALAHAAAQMQWQPRDTGSEGWKQCGDYIADQLQQAGWQVENQRFPYHDVECRNIIGRRGSGPRVIIGAHYDARRRSDQDKDPAKQNEVVPSANDGASGIAVLLELASVLRPEELGFEVWLAAFDAEDNGDIDGWEWVVGSRYMANSLTEAPAAVIVIDMIGDADQQIYYEGSSDPALREAIWGVAGDLALASFVPQVRYSMLDDHTPFLQRGYRAIDIIDFDYPYWHTTQDTLDKVSAPSLAAVGKTLEEWLLRGGQGIQTADSMRPAYQA